MMTSIQLLLLSVATLYAKCQGFVQIHESSILSKNIYYSTTTSHNLRKVSVPFHRSTLSPSNIGRNKSSIKRNLINNDQPDLIPTQDGDESLQLGSQWSSPLDKPVLATLDFVALTIFAAVGKASHSSNGALDLGAVFITAFPFLVSWFATSPLTGVYNDFVLKGEEDDDNDYLDIAIATLKGWALAVPLGCAGRGIIKGYVPPLPFVIVTLISTLVILTTVRLLYTAVGKQIK